MSARYDIVGCGSVVRQHHVPALRSLMAGGEVTIAGCFDLNVESARDLGERLGAQRSGSQPTPRPGDGVDAALIATPPTTHARIALDYIRAGKSVLVEKPFTAMAADAAALVREADSHGVRILVNHGRRYLPNANIARRFLDGRLGEVEALEASDGMRWDWATGSNYLVEDPFGGVIHDSGSHLLDVVLYVLGLDTAGARVSAEVTRIEKRPAREPAHECRASMALAAAKQSPIGLEFAVSRLQPLARGVKVHGSFGTLFVPFTYRAPMLLRGGRGLWLDSVGTADESTDPGALFLLAHRELLGALESPGARGRIDGERFVALEQMLEVLHEAGVE